MREHHFNINSARQVEVPVDLAPDTVRDMIEPQTIDLTERCKTRPALIIVPGKRTTNDTILGRW